MCALELPCLVANSFQQFVFWGSRGNSLYINTPVSPYVKIGIKITQEQLKEQPTVKARLSHSQQVCRFVKPDHIVNGFRTQNCWHLSWTALTSIVASRENLCQARSMVWWKENGLWISVDVDSNTCSHKLVVWLGITHSTSLPDFIFPIWKWVR